MARPLRIEYPGAIYHVTSRLVGRWQEHRDRLFRDQQDFRRFEEQLAERVREFGVRLYLFCLMANHYHLILETPQGNLSRFMQSLATAYSVYFNLRHRRHGHLFDGRFKAKAVSGDEYLLKLSRYVHQNPAWMSHWAKRSIAERIRHLESYRWSSYPGYIGLRTQVDFVEQGPVLAMMGGPKKQRAERYRQFVNSGLAEGDEELLEAMQASQYGIGELQFRQWVERQRSKRVKNHSRREDVAFRRRVALLPASQVMEAVGSVFGFDKKSFAVRKRGSLGRAVLARYLVRDAGKTQREAAAIIGVTTGAAVNIQLKRLKEAAAKDKKLRQRLKRLDQEFEQMRAAE
jgi:putative transposase